MTSRSKSADEFNVLGGLECHKSPDSRDVKTIEPNRLDSSAVRAVRSHLPDGGKS
jgi:hypothetical protein